jgi:YfiR/HmsC-like
MGQTTPTDSAIPILRRSAARLRALTAIGLLLFAGRAVTQPPVSDADVKAAYLFNFGKFMRVAGVQPQNATFDICILGRDPIGPALDQVAANGIINSHPVRVRRLGDATQARVCQIVFISPYEGERMREDLAILTGAGALTVSDARDFLDLGGMIEFVLEGEHVRFKVNLSAVDRAHLVLSSELLRVAESVEGRPRPGGQP